MDHEFEDLVSAIRQLPGIGPKAASRVALYLIENKELSNGLSSTLVNACQKLGKCFLCGNLSKINELCVICMDSKKDHTKIALVASVTDIFAIENSGVYDGLYYVFTNISNLFSDKEAFDRNVQGLESMIRFQKNEKIEIIFALPYNIDTEVACSVISDELSVNETEIAISRIALGMPSGADFDYTDKLTIMKSFKGRTYI